jgi:hypothetical protein
MITKYLYHNAYASYFGGCKSFVRAFGRALTAYTEAMIATTTRVIVRGVGVSLMIRFAITSSIYNDRGCYEHQLFYTEGETWSST